MAKSLDRLLDFLLEEIALDGDQGVILKDIATYIKKFYNSRVDAKPNDSTPVQQRAFKLDEAFLARVWEWLTREDDIVIDDPADLKSWSFAQLKAQYPGILDGIDFDHIIDSEGAETTQQTTSPYCPRISVDTYRIHHAICGHGPDPSRVPASEYALLSVIARSREEGILQGVAGRLTGQDKRSVPKRTDLLHSKGYIVKKTVLAGGQKTSRLILKRFANTPDTASAYLIKDLSLRIVSTLQSDRFMTQDNLATILSLADPVRRRVLNQVVGQLVRRKCLKKVKAAFGPDSGAGELKICLQVVRELEDDDWTLQDQDVISFTISVDEAVVRAQNEIDTADPDANEIADGADIDQIEEQEALQFVPQWNPDRLMPNMLFDLAASFGEEGITNASARGMLTGFSVRRPLESTLVRVSHSSLKRQPPHIRDLGIVRSTEVENAIARYVHRTFSAFDSLVQQGVADWSAVEGGAAFQKSNSKNATEAVLKDEFEFPVRKPPAGQVSNGLVDLTRVARVPEAKSVRTSTREIQLVDLENGDVNLLMTTAMEPEGSKKNARTKSVPKTRNPPVKKVTKAKYHPQGRPRKFTRGTEKFWRDMLLVRKLENDPAFSRRAGIAGLTQDVELLDWYNDRPLQYDDTILHIQEHGLPLPHKSSQVSQSWLDEMNAYMSRGGIGAFVTPIGATKVLKGIFQCIVTIRSPRLSELDICEHPKIPDVLFISSSVAHTFRIPNSTKLSKNKSNKKPDFKIIRKVPDPEPKNALDRTTSQSASASIRAISATPETAPSTPTRRKRGSGDTINDKSLESNTSTLETRLPRRKARKLTSAIDEPRTPPKQSEMPLNEDASIPTTGRSTRARKLTQKALESHSGTRPGRRRSSAASRPNLTMSDKDIADELQDTNVEPVADQVPAEAISCVEELKTPVQGPKTYEWNLQPPDLSTSKTSKDVHPLTAIDECRVNGANLGTPESSSIRRDWSAVEISDGRMFTADDPASLLEIPDVTQATPMNNSNVVSTITSVGQSMSSDPKHPTTVEYAKFVSVPEATASSRADQDPEMLPFTPESAEPTNLQTTGTDSVVLEARISHDSASPAVETIPILKGRDAVEHYKIILLEIIHMCGGVIPNSPMLWRRAVRAKSFEVGVDDNPSVKLLRSQMNILAARGKVKIMNFAYQRNGLNHTKAIVALPHTQLTDPNFLSLQQKMTALPVEDEYIAPELQAEIDRKPSTTAKRDLFAGKVARAARPKAKNRAGKQVEQPQQEQATPKISAREPEPAIVPSSPPPSPTPPPTASINTGFLTLKVPKIAQIHTSNTFTSHYFDLNPATVIRFEADANAAATQTALPTPASQRRSGIRIPRATTYQPGHGKIQWAIPKQSKPVRRLAIPTSLKAILSNKKEGGLNLTLEPFERDLERVRLWEENNIALLRDPRPQEWHFINHPMPKKDFTSVRDPSDLLVFQQVRIIDRAGDSDLLEIEETDMPEEESWDHFRDALIRARSRQKQLDDAASKRKRKFDDYVEQDDDDPDFLEPAGSNVVSKQSRPKRKKTKTDRKKAAEEASGSKRTRGIGLRRLSKEHAHQVCISFVVVRVLAGGLDKHIDFSLVERLNPTETEGILRERWKALSHAYLADLDAFTQDFQIKYLDALAEDKVPSVDYSNIVNTDWEGILQWALQSIDTSGKDIPLDIPPTREDFLALNKVDVIEPPPVRNLYHQGQVYTIASKESIWCSTVSGIAKTGGTIRGSSGLEVMYSTEESEQDKDIARAKSWILAAVLTKKQAYDPVRTRTKLRCLAPTEAECDGLLASTMKQMQADKTIVRQESADALSADDGSSYSGTHGWKISRKWFDKFDMNRNVTFSMLQDAVKYKLQILDPAFANGKQVNLGRAPYLDDGCMVAIFNLLDQGLIRIVPGADVPISRYGLDWEDQGYKTRSMDRDALAFSTMLQPTSAYTHGDPAESIRKAYVIPRGSMDQDDGMGFIPAWFNINQEFQPQIWHMAIGAVVGLIALRPGISSLEILRNMGWALQRQDLDMVVQYLFDCGFIERAGEGWETTEWWWLAIGGGRIGGESVIVE